jgi:hypothetical protein
MPGPYPTAGPDPYALLGPDPDGYVGCAPYVGYGDAVRGDAVGSVGCAPGEDGAT